MKIDWKKHFNNIPNRVQIKGKTYYEVLWIDDFPDGETMGETRFDPKQIVIKKGLSEKESVITYLHEICHAYSEENGSNLTEKQILQSEKFFPYLLKSGNIFLNNKTSKVKQRCKKRKVKKK